MRIVSNINLCEKSISQKYFVYLRGQSLSDGRQIIHFRPCGLKIDATLQTDITLWNTTASARKAIKENLVHRAVGECIVGVKTETIETKKQDTFSECEQEKKNYSMLDETDQSPDFIKNKVELKAKVVSDHIEAVIGAFYLFGGYEAAEKCIMYGFNLIPSFRDPSETNILNASDRNLAHITYPQFTSQFSLFPSSHNIMQMCNDFQSFMSSKLLSFYHKSVAVNGIVKDTISPMTVESLSYAPKIRSYSDVTRRQIDIYTGSGASIGSICRELHWIDIAKSEYSSIAELINYHFCDKSYLDLVFHKPSHHLQFERLEFLGDAVLDTAVLLQLHRFQRWATPGHLSFQKSDATSNTRLAAIALEYGLDEYINKSGFAEKILEGFQNIELWRQNKEAFKARCSKTYGTNEIANFCVAKVQKMPYQTLSSITEYSVNSESIHEDVVLPWKVDENAEMTKAFTTVEKYYSSLFESHVLLLKTNAGLQKLLADTFEALLGAIFCDSNGNLDIITSIVHKLNMLPQIKITNNI